MMMTKAEAKALGLYNIDKWYGARNFFTHMSLQDAIGIPKEMQDENSKVYVITTKDFAYGAAVLADIDYIDNLSRELDSDLVILPSSIHEILVMPVDNTNPKVFEGIIGDVNSREVPMDIRLGDEPLIYLRKANKIVKFG